MNFFLDKILNDCKLLHYMDDRDFNNIFLIKMLGRIDILDLINNTVFEIKCVD
jgi:hypothetical protein